ncbi:hypothetical protein NQ315_008426 [Exocentrus adspersus]|uniref:Uncharacterized protein n=1 Tax=Exocentrus adspersus TaxID=1586481 RepID=A0AAV8W5B3_9CUCU|nr:hypothetical protein NQ315_008426 [Exocentrus adspersus]
MSNKEDFFIKKQKYCEKSEWSKTVLSFFIIKLRQKISLKSGSSQRAHRSRQYERGSSAERRYKRSHRRSPTSKKHRHRHDDRTHSRRKESWSCSPTNQVSILSFPVILSSQVVRPETLSIRN